MEPPGFIYYLRIQIKSSNLGAEVKRLITCFLLIFMLGCATSYKIVCKQDDRTIVDIYAYYYYFQGNGNVLIVEDVWGTRKANVKVKANSFVECFRYEVEDE